MKKATIVALCALAASSAAAQSLGERTGADSLLGVTPTTQDFVTEVANGDMFEIQSSQLALQKADAQAKAFAQHMIADHQKTTSELLGLLKTANIQATPPATIDSALQARLDKLKKETGRDFTNNYDERQVSAHKEAVSLFERYAKGGDNAQLKAWAGKTLPTLQQHLQMAQGLNK